MAPRPAPAAACFSRSTSTTADSIFMPVNWSIAASSRALSVVKSCVADASAPGENTPT